jgi:transposase
LNKDLMTEIGKIPSTNNQIEDGINARLRDLLRNHRGLSIERRIKAVFWWGYMHSPRPLPVSEILKVMPTDKSIAAIYQKILNARNVLHLSLHGEMLWYGESCTSRLNFRIIGTSDQHVLSYNPKYTKKLY